jgi:hypothetical protein
MAETLAVIRPTMRVADNYGETLSDLAAELRSAELDAEVRIDPEEKFFDPLLTDLAVQLFGAIQDHAVEAAVAALFGWIGGLRRKRKDPGLPTGRPDLPRKAQILGPNGEILREVDLIETDGDA